MAERMNTGLMKLIEATESVNELSRELAVKEKELYIASMKADKVSFQGCNYQLNQHNWNCTFIKGLTPCVSLTFVITIYLSSLFYCN